MERDLRGAVLGQVRFDPGSRGQAGAVDCLQMDLTRCGGYTGFLRAAAVANSFHLPLSTHTAAQLHTQVAPAIPNLRNIEWFIDHMRVSALLFDGIREPAAGALGPNRTGQATG